MAAHVVPADDWTGSAMSDALDTFFRTYDGLADYKRPRRYLVISNMEYNEVTKKLRMNFG